MQPIIVVSRRATKQQEKLRAQGYAIVDVTSKSPDETFRRFSPFFPHGDVTVPGLPRSTSVEGLWQGLKAFENEGPDPSKFRAAAMANLKRPANARRGRVLGHRFGLEGELLDYLAARRRIYLPAYRDVLDRHLRNELALLRGLLDEGTPIALLDYETNCDPDDPSKPLSHAALIKAHLESEGAN